MVGLKAKKDRKLIADNVKRQDCVPLSEFEAYKQKTKQAIETLIKKHEGWLKEADKTAKNYPMEDKDSNNPQWYGMKTNKQDIMIFLGDLKELKAELELI